MEYLLPFAIQVGLPVDEFWYGDESLLEAYSKAYERDIQCKGWINGIYNMKALEVVVNNVMPSAIGIGVGGGKIKPIQYYDEPIDAFKEGSKKKNTESATTESGFRKGMLGLNDFIMSD